MVPQIHFNEKLNGLLMGNIRGLFPRSNQTKVKALEDMATLNGIGIIALSESHLSSDIYDSEIMISDFECHRCDRSVRSHG